MYIINYNNKIAKVILKPFKKENDYNLVAKDIFTFGDDDYLLYKHTERDMTKKRKENIKVIDEFYSHIKVDKKYLYLINNDTSIDFTKIDNNVFNEINKYFLDYQKSYFNLDSYEYYRNHFFKNDHHWNYKGSYQGYQDIMKMLYPNQYKKIIRKPIKEIKLESRVRGSKEKRSKFKISDEKFVAYDFDIPEYTLKINGRKTEYGLRRRIHNGYKYTADNISYGDFYGSDYAEVVYDFHNKEKDNLLIIGFSDTNAINELLASHFNKTFILDPRYYTYKDVNKYIKDNKIDRILLVFNPKTFNTTCADFKG